MYRSSGQAVAGTAQDKLVFCVLRCQRIHIGVINGGRDGNSLLVRVARAGSAGKHRAASLGGAETGSQTAGHGIPSSDM